MSDTESVDLETAGLLDADNIPNANQSINCFSCGESMSGVYCYACGNKNDDYRRSIWSFNPGRMAREFSDGARQKWTSPIRMYLATSLLLFGYIALSQTQLVAFGTKSGDTSIVKMGNDNSDFIPQIFFLERKSTIQKTVTEDAIKAFEKDINDDEDKSKEALERELEGVKTALAKYDAQIENAGNDFAKAGMAQGRIPFTEQIERLESRID